jgi:hypothetical protein
MNNSELVECLFYKELKSDERISALNLKKKGKYFEVQIGSKKEILIKRELL